MNTYLCYGHSHIENEIKVYFERNSLTKNLQGLSIKRMLEKYDLMLD